MLILENVHSYYGRAHILDGISLSVNEGEIVALLGRNGAGKSTTFKSIMNLTGSVKGKISYRGVGLTGKPNYQIARLGVGYVPEERRIFGRLTTLENLLAGKRTSRAGHGPWTVERLFKIFPKLDEIKNREARFLSGGEQQMLTIARTLMTNPDCLLLDEPTEGLAPVIVSQVVTAIKDLKEQGLSILISEQGQHMSGKFADRLYILEKGQIVFSGTPNELDQNPALRNRHLAVH